MKNSKALKSLAFAIALVLVGGARLASAQWVGPTPTPVTGVQNGAVHSDGKNANGVEESTEKGANGAENKNPGDTLKPVPATVPIKTVDIK